MTNVTPKTAMAKVADCPDKGCPTKSGACRLHGAYPSGYEKHDLLMRQRPFSGGGEDETPISTTATLTAADADALTLTIQRRLGAIVGGIERAQAGGAHDVLGFSSWTAYTQANFGALLARLAKANRLPLVPSQCPVAGHSCHAVGECAGVPAMERPLPDAYRDTSLQVLKAVESLSRLRRDDRFTSNRAAVTRCAAELARAANDLLDDLGVDRHYVYGGTR